MKKVYLGMAGGITLALGMAALTAPVQASTFNTDKIVLELTVANGVGYEWGLDQVNRDNLVNHLTGNDTLKLEKADGDNVIKMLDSLNKFVTDTGSNPAKVAALKTALLNLKNLQVDTSINGALVLDDALVNKVKSVFVDGGLINSTPGFKLKVSIAAGPTGVLEMSNLTDGKFDALLENVEFSGLLAEKVKTKTPEQLDKLRAMMTTGGPLLHTVTQFEVTEPHDKTDLKNKIRDAKTLAAEEAAKKPELAMEWNALNAAVVAAEAEQDNDELLKAVMDNLAQELVTKMAALRTKMVSLKAPNTGEGASDYQAGMEALVAAGVVATLVGALVVLISKKA